MTRHFGCWYDQDIRPQASFGIHIDYEYKNIGVFILWWTIWVGWMYRSGRDDMADGRIGRR